jgi:putative ABC transport system permease protein
MLWEMIIREFNRHRLRTALTILGVTIGIFLVVSVSSFSEGIIYYVNDQIKITSGLVTVHQSDIAGFNIQTSEIDQSLVTEVESLSGVEKVAPILYANIDNVGTVMGVTKEGEVIFRGTNINEKEGRDFDEDQKEVTVGSKQAETNNYVVGDYIQMVEVNFEIVGILEETGRDQIDNGIIMPLSELQDLTGKKDTITLIMVQPSTPEDADYIEQAINDNFSDIEAMTDKSLMKSANEMLSQLNAMTFALGSIAALISGIVIMNVMIISVRERRREIGTMKAIGATNRQILFSVLMESIVISVTGAVIGILLSYGGVAFINSILFRPIALVTPGLIVEALLFATSIGIVSGVTPARQAARLDPIESLRYE